MVWKKKEKQLWGDKTAGNKARNQAVFNYGFMTLMYYGLMGKKIQGYGNLVGEFHAN